MERVAKAARVLKAVSTVTQEGEVSAVTLRIGPQQSRHRRSRRPAQRKNLVNLGQDLVILEQDLMYLGHDTRFLTKVTKILTKIFSMTLRF